jgi:hypothetical protein
MTPTRFSEVPRAARRAADGWRAAAGALAEEVDSELIAAAHDAVLGWVGRWYEEVVEPNGLEDEPVPPWSDELGEPKIVARWLLPVADWTERFWETPGEDDDGRGPWSGVMDAWVGVAALLDGRPRDLRDGYLLDLLDLLGEPRSGR